jgi:hypothetical protein
VNAAKLNTAWLLDIEQVTVIKVTVHGQVVGLLPLVLMQVNAANNSTQLLSDAMLAITAKDSVL